MKEHLAKIHSLIQSLRETSVVGEKHDFGRSRDWLLGLGLATGVALMLVGIGLYEFFTQDEVEQNLQNQNSITAMREDAIALDRIRSAYQARTAEFMVLRNTAQSAPNPDGRITSTDLHVQEVSDVTLFATTTPPVE